MAARKPSAPRVLVVISYFADQSRYPRSGHPDVRGWTYWANIAASAATLQHVAPEAECIVFSGDQPPDDAAAVLRSCRADVRHRDFDHQPPEDFYERYAGSLYLLDTIEVIASEASPDDVVMFVDPDVVWANPLDRLLEEIRRGGIVAYDLDVPDTVLMCHLTRREQSDLVTAMTGRGPEAEERALTHFGGEFYGMRGAELPSVVSALGALWSETMRRYEQGLPHFHVEEHLFNAVLWQRGEQTGRANPYVQRVLTLPHPFGTRERIHPDLVAWHLPMEKDKGLVKLFRELAAGSTMPAPGARYQQWLGHRVGTHPVGVRWIADRARRVKWAINGAARNRDPQYGL